MALFQRAQLTVDVHSTKGCCRCCHRCCCCISCSFSSCGHTQITPVFWPGSAGSGVGLSYGDVWGCSWQLFGGCPITTSTGTGSAGCSQVCWG